MTEENVNEEVVVDEPVMEEPAAPEVKEKNDIQAIIKILMSTKAVAIPSIKLFDDGKIDLTDMGDFISIAQGVPELIDAFKDFAEAFDEAKDIDGDEAVALIKLIYKIGKEIKEEVDALKK